MGLVGLISYGIEASFWLDLFLFLLMIGLLIFLFNAILRKILKVKKKKRFSYNYLNERHEKIDRAIRITFIVAMIIGGIINIARSPSSPILFLQPHFILFVSVFSSEIVRAVMEWKHAENKNDAIFTVLQLIFLTILVFSIYITDFFGFFE